jgi:hypothetical protein
MTGPLGAPPSGVINNLNPEMIFTYCLLRQGTKRVHRKRYYMSTKVHAK